MSLYHLCLGLFFALVFGLFYTVTWLEKRYESKHPPEDWDGVREERFDEPPDSKKGAVRK